MDRYPEAHLFGPLGIEDYVWKVTPAGLPDGLGGLHLEAEDLARIGYLYLRDGVWDGELLRRFRIGLTYDGRRHSVRFMPERHDDTATLPSDAELKLLRELWAHGEQSVSVLHERVQDYWPVGYTTVLKLLQRMTDKGLVTRRQKGRAHLYRPAVAREKTERRVARTFVQQTFGGSIEALLQSALPTGHARAREIEEIRRLLDRLED